MSKQKGFCSSQYCKELLAIVLRECRRLDGDTVEGADRFNVESRKLLVLFSTSYGQRNFRSERKKAIIEYERILELTKQKGFDI